MTANLINVFSELVWIFASIAVLLVFAVVIVLRSHARVPPGSSGHRDARDEGGHEEVRGDGYIDTFAGDIAEAGGGLPPIVKLAVPAVLLSWLLYLVLNWTP